MNYRRPPITEAVIELRFEQPVGQPLIEKAARRLQEAYPVSEDENGVNVNFDVARGTSQVDVLWQGKKSSNYDRTEVCIYRTTGFIVSRLAPYTGWERFVERAQAGWANWKKTAGHTKISRIGVRYINRLDVPMGDLASVEIHDYLSVYPAVPTIANSPMEFYTMQVQSGLPYDECRLVLSSGSVASPILGHFSFLVDIDISRESNVPQKDDEIFAFIDRVHTYKNDVFEQCITDKSRALFGT